MRGPRDDDQLFFGVLSRMRLLIQFDDDVIPPAE
jgi:hypothetical protein